MGYLCITWCIYIFCVLTIVLDLYMETENNNTQIPNTQTDLLTSRQLSATGTVHLSVCSNEEITSGVCAHLGQCCAQCAGTKQGPKTGPKPFSF